MECGHEFIESELLLADGYCVECLLTRIEELETEIAWLEESLEKAKSITRNE